MSQENVEIVRAAFEAWKRDDFDTWFSSIDPTVEWHTVLEQPFEGAGSVYRGLDGMRRFWDAYRTDIGSMEVDTQEYRDVGDDRVVFLGWFRWRGLRSGIESETPLGLVVTVRDAKIVQSIDYL